MLNPSELLEETGTREEGTEAVDADLVGRELGCKAFGCLNPKEIQG